MSKRTMGLMLVVFSSAAYLYTGLYLERKNFAELIFLFTILFAAYFLLLKISSGNDEFLFWSGVAFRITLLFCLPFLSQDFYRFVWDGNLVASGQNPYMFLPDLYMQDALHQTAENTLLHQGMGTLSAGSYSNYPPLNQMLFAIPAILKNKSYIFSSVCYKLFILLADVGIYFFGKKILKQLNLPKANIFLYFLNPLVIIEGCGNEHFEPVMILLLVISLCLLLSKRLFWSAIMFGAAISIKLVPLMFLPLLLPYLKLKKAVLFSLVALATFVVFFLPFVSSDLIAHYSTTVGLWFTKFEFNASVYYLLRQVGYAISGYNQIAVIGKILPVVTIACIAFLSLRKKQVSFTQLITYFLFAGTIYFFLSTTVHPWYVLTLIALSIFTHYRFSIAWSALAALSYYAYANDAFHENYLILMLEYLPVYGYLLFELLHNKVSDAHVKHGIA